MEAWWMIQMGMQRTVVTEQENAIRRLDKVGLLMEGSFSEIPWASTHVHWCMWCKDLAPREFPPTSANVHRCLLPL
jgi:hypothetical protein